MSGSELVSTSSIPQNTTSNIQVKQMREIYAIYYLFICLFIFLIDPYFIIAYFIIVILSSVIISISQAYYHFECLKQSNESKQDYTIFVYYLEPFKLLVCLSIYLIIYQFM